MTFVHNFIVIKFKIVITVVSESVSLTSQLFCFTLMLYHFSPATNRRSSNASSTLNTTITASVVNRMYTDVKMHMREIYEKDQSFITSPEPQSMEELEDVTNEFLDATKKCYR